MKSAFVKMTKRAFVSEHKELIKVLKGKNRKKQIKEAKEQEQELAKFS